ncbi:DUF4232 domain-containing protein, partial [Streptomyces sp. NPDC004646]
MRIRALAAASAVLASGAVLLTAPAGHAAPARVAPCTQGELTVRAAAVPAERTVVRFSVTNRGGRACTVERVPVVSFGGSCPARATAPRCRRARGRGARGRGAGGAGTGR